MFVHGKIIMFGPKNSVCLCAKKRGEWGGSNLLFMCIDSFYKSKCSFNNKN